MNRYRLVTFTANRDRIERHVSPVVVTRSEAWQLILAEKRLHEQSGWRTRLEDAALICERGSIERRIKVRRSTPFNDTV